MLCEGQSHPFGARSDRSTIEQQPGRLHGGPVGCRRSGGVQSVSHPEFRGVTNVCFFDSEMILTSRTVVGLTQPFKLMLVHLFPLRNHKSVRIQTKVMW